MGRAGIANAAEPKHTETEVNKRETERTEEGRPRKREQQDIANRRGENSGYNSPGKSRYSTSRVWHPGAGVLISFGRDRRSLLRSTLRLLFGNPPGCGEAGLFE
jgi:hypothetical protein